jgi:hypothetical protein
MSTPKPHWDYLGDLAPIPETPDELREELRGILDADGETFMRFCSRLCNNALFPYRVRKDDRKGERRAPSPGELRAAADELRREAAALAAKVSPPTGGLELLIESCLLLMASDARHRFLPELRNSLYRLSGACAEIQRKPDDELVRLEVQPELPELRDLDPRKLLAVDVAFLFHRVLGRDPTADCSTDDPGKRGSYARVLAAVFRHVDGEDLSSGSLAKLVKAGTMGFESRLAELGEGKATSGKLTSSHTGSRERVRRRPASFWPQ